MRSALPYMGEESNNVVPASERRRHHRAGEGEIIGVQCLRRTHPNDRDHGCVGVLGGKRSCLHVRALSRRVSTTDHCGNPYCDIGAARVWVCFVSAEVEKADGLASRSQTYDLFILVLTVLSLVLMVVMFLPLNDATIGLPQFYDNLICAIFLIDFAIQLHRAERKADYFVGQRGWLDLLGSIPSLGVVFKYSGLFRHRPTEPTGADHPAHARQAARRNCSRRLAQPEPVRVLHHRPHAMIVLCSSSVVVLQFESARGGRQHRQRMGRVLVQRGDGHHCRLRRLLPRDGRRPDRR